MSTDEEMISAVRAMTPSELNTFVAMKLVAITRTQEDCNKGCQEQLLAMQRQVDLANIEARKVAIETARLKGWFKGMWAVVICLLGAVAAGVVALVKR